MKILINASNLKKGGGLQVADSICSLLSSYPQHRFIVVLSSNLLSTFQKMRNISNINAIQYDMPKSITTVLFKRNRFLDTLVKIEKIDVVITIFGPSLWVPKCRHISGFARAQCVLTDSPYFKNMPFLKKFREILYHEIMIREFCRCSDIYYTENGLISEKLRDLFPSKTICTISNYYNQVFDKEELWKHNIKLEPYEGTTLLTISANYPHKNLAIIKPTILYLRERYPQFLFRFVLTIEESDFYPITDDEKKCIVFLGKVTIEECPNLYVQSDIAFLPTLLECFSASYPEAMRMGKPIITSDLDFAYSLCGDAAIYYDALSPQALGDAIYKVMSDKGLYTSLIEKGKKQLLEFDNYEVRVNKLIALAENQKCNN